jgi:putative Mg2+ transporter-C (MgtC) family protein
MLEALNFNQMQILILGEVALAALLGALIGFEREVSQKPAGLRTHMLVAGAAALVVGLSSVAVIQFSSDLSSEVITDPIRIMEAVITGVSFLGAGTIIHRRSENVVEGLTTAASILVAAGIGIAVALSQFALAIGVTVLVLITLRGLSYVERWLARHNESQTSPSAQKPQESYILERERR